MTLNSSPSHMSLLRGVARELPQPCLLHEYLAKRISEHPHLARTNGLIFQDFTMSYEELYRRAKVVSERLQRTLGQCYGTNDLLGDHSGWIIAVDVQPCCELVVILLAVLQLGGSFVPIDSHSAINRVRYILHETSPVCIIVDSTSVFTRDSDTVWSKFKVIELDQILGDKDMGNDLDIIKHQEGGLSVDGNTTAAVIYTSGSTGHPKGVKLTHKTVMNRICWQWEAMPYREGETGCFKTSFLFVDSIVEIFGAVLQLKPMVIAEKHVVNNPEFFIDLLEMHHVTRLTMVPSLLHNMLFYLSVSGGSTRLPDLRLWVSNSETLRPSLVRKFFELFSQERILYNLYGSTETMADVSYEVFCGAEDAESKCLTDDLSIGRPMHNSSMYILDSDLAILSKGEVGQICVSGYNVAEGYIDENGALNTFITNPFKEHDGFPVLYLTGDFGRVIKDRIIYEGRRDQQVKIRGQRVNISEIEKVVNECQHVSGAVVLCHHFSEVSSVIVAYYKTSSKVGRTKVESTILKNCERCLPSYMRPKLVNVEEVPHQPHTGKIDRMALRKIYEKAFNRQSSQELAVIDEKGRKALNIIALNLNLPTHAIPKTKSFFEMGGNSVSMISTIVQLKHYDLHIPIEVFSNAQTIQDIIHHVTESKAPIGEILHTEKYVIKRLSEVGDCHHIIDILTDSFVEKEPLDVLLGVTKPEFLTFAKSLYREALSSNLSLVVLDRDSLEVVGGDFLFDYFSGVKVEHHQSMAPILSLMRKFEGPVKERLLKQKTGALVYNFCLCVQKDLPHAEQVKICHLIEESVLKAAKDNDFVGVLTNNTNPATQDICQHFFGYEVLSSYLVKDFIYNGRNVFSHAPEDYYIKMMIKYV